ncbi:MAG: four helix bundle protein [Verrucomicrobiae bacterium]|nr:four helix bundle protein [Verrucomicrobiae bacterium]
MNSDSFRFEDMEIWIRAVDLSMPVFDIADNLEERKRYRFSEQLRGPMLSVTNNMAEGSGSDSDKDFAHFLNIARRSIFEVANMLIVFHRRRLIPDRPVEILRELVELSKMSLAFRRTLLAGCGSEGPERRPGIRKSG